jgi:hypothetical protein
MSHVVLHRSTEDTGANMTELRLGRVAVEVSGREAAMMRSEMTRRKGTQARDNPNSAK